MDPACFVDQPIIPKRTPTFKKLFEQFQKDIASIEEQEQTFSEKTGDFEAKVETQLQTSTLSETATSLSPKELPVASGTYLLPQKSNIDEVIEEFERIHDECKFVEHKTKYRKLFNIADIGGQPAFLEMLPSLTIGPALYLVFMKLLQGLKTRYPVAFKCKDGKGLKLCKNYTYTSEEVIFTALSSIACFGNSDEEVEKYVSKIGDVKQTNSYALLIGTFKDKIKDEKHLDEINNQLKQQLEMTDFFKKGLIHSNRFLEVDNYSATEAKIEEHRKLVEMILDKKFRHYEIPTRWLTLSICLKLLARIEGRHEVSFDDCVKLGTRLGMAKNMVKVALKFLHKYIGLIMYFPNNVQLENVVICDPQVVFSSISELIFDIYDPKKLYVTEAQHDHFVRTGCFSPQDIKCTNEEKSTKIFLSTDTLVSLLVYLNIAAEVPTISSVEEAQADHSQQKKYYFLPAVLQTAEISFLSRGENEELLPEPLCIRFRTGYLPLGFVCALSANLIAESKFTLIPFNEDGQQITYKNKMKFRFRGKFDIAGHKYCEFRVSRWSGKADFWESGCCPSIKTTICEAADRVIQSLQHGSLFKDLSYELAFRCPMHQDIEIGHEPLAKIVYDIPKASSLIDYNYPKELICTSPSCASSVDLSPEMKMWFGEAIEQTPPQIIKETSMEENKIIIQVKGTKPLTFQWFKGSEELTDGDSYNGTTTAKLTILGNGHSIKGDYKCKVVNKFGKIFSKEFQYDPFAKELKIKGLRDSEITKLIENGVETFHDMKEMKEQDFISIGLNVGEKKRVKVLISSLHKGGEFESTSKQAEAALWDIRAKWYLLGIQLEIDHSTLETLRKDCSDIESRFVSVLQHFFNYKSQMSMATQSCLVEALQSPSVNRPDLIANLPALELSFGQQSFLDNSKKSAIRLKKLVNSLWEVRATWERIAESDDLIQSGTCEAIINDYPNTEERFAAFLHEHIKGDQDPRLEKIIDALRSVSVDRHDIANDLERMIKKEEI